MKQLSDNPHWGRLLAYPQTLDYDMISYPHQDVGTNLAVTTVYLPIPKRWGLPSETDFSNAPHLGRLLALPANIRLG